MIGQLLDTEQVRGLCWLLAQSTNIKTRLGTMKPSICGCMAEVASTCYRLLLARTSVISELNENVVRW